ncbi:hypothetical protein ACO2Q8_07880 [Larkinella sp. VNQ87]|uniref:hypothetical protein n=1 Tax=Larkinella sp. VNQ87 TaxID=3400921 RepID=UPI003C071513
MEQLYNLVSSPYGRMIVWCVLVLLLAVGGGVMIGYILGDRERRQRNAFQHRPDEYHSKI